ncbi:hypothetical protein HMPREF9248_0030 [Fannyhessea vaginae PB189-T1-4]|uniref:Uncharacterized protein n=1 Tax=Fannyhessea vaginae PB189-T1-4 TaxID=866774 RepID=A0ABN0B1P2_9ACTN|nr:hypothetical protein HMPREF9248_0030 [Fannyhessea vaginae PB189-T1-4]
MCINCVAPTRRSPALLCFTRIIHFLYLLPGVSLCFMHDYATLFV